MSEIEKWAAKVKQFRASGKSQWVWSKENDVNLSTLRCWIERSDELLDGSKVTFAEIEVGGDEQC